MSIPGESFAEAIIKRLRNKKVEIYLGDSGRTQEWNDYAETQKSVIRGVLLDADSECFVVLYTNKLGKSNEIYINSWCVSSILEPKNGISIVDVYCDESNRQDK